MLNRKASAPALQTIPRAEPGQVQLTIPQAVSAELGALHECDQLMISAMRALAFGKIEVALEAAEKLNMLSSHAITMPNVVGKAIAEVVEEAKVAAPQPALKLAVTSSTKSTPVSAASSSMPDTSADTTAACTFYVIKVAWLHKYGGKKLPFLQELRDKHPEALERITITYGEVVCGKHVRDVLSVSHRWMKADDPECALAWAQHTACPM